LSPNYQQILMRYEGGGDIDRLLEIQTKVSGKLKYKTKPLLHQAAYAGNVAVAQVLMRATAKEHLQKLVNTYDKKWKTPLHWAAAAGKNSMVELLLGMGANINCRTLKAWGAYFIILILKSAHN